MDINHYERASKIWDLLVNAASKKETITYKDITQKSGIHWRAQHIPLGYIQNYCLEYDLPPLTILAVNNSTKLPGSGFIACNPNKIKAEAERVCQFNWSDYENPFLFANNTTLKNIIKAIQKSDFNNESIIKIKSRGILQSLLKDAALTFYDNQCAMCGISIEELLEACHIKPYADCTDDEKKDLRNIIILCKNHHKLFDSGLITIDTDYKMHIKSSIKIKSSSDRGLFQHIDNVRIHLPNETNVYPGKEYINYLNNKG